MVKDGPSLYILLFGYWYFLTYHKILLLLGKVAKILINPENKG